MILFGMIYLIRNFPVFTAGCLLLLMPASLFAQDRRLEYQVMHHGEVKGTVQIKQHTEGNTVQIKIESLVQNRFLFKITVQTIEEAVFREGLLIFSRYYQKINNEEKHDRQLNWEGGYYRLSGRKEDKTAPQTRILHTVLSLYLQEPLNFREVYSDNFQQDIPVIPVAPGKYKLTLPNGNKNYYYYQKGTLVRVEVEQPFYAVQFILNH